uniref:Heparan-sulfate 6-O-sulfotransferase n=1 Tax=Panagrellus redivivus TaxID=6233 RepID=A0A7E4WCA1_PANRE
MPNSTEHSRRQALTSTACRRPSAYITMKTDNRAMRQRCTGIISIVFILLGIGLFISYFYVDFHDFGDASYTSIGFTSRYSIDEMRGFAYKNGLSRNFKPKLYVRWNLSFNRMFEDSENKFDLAGKDVLVFLHIQKTAGTSFERFLVRYLDTPTPCSCNLGKKRCNCPRPHAPAKSKASWLFSRYSTGWACGLHADFTELSVSGCVDHVMDKREGTHKKRRYFYTTFLRDPVSRFISEYRHVERGATWLASRHVCNGKPPTPDQLPMCFDPDVGWEGVPIEEFLSCPYNLAFNRMTRMLADLTLVHCYDHSSMNSSTRDRIMLESAKNNLRNFAFFGIKERMDDSQFMFEKAFNMKFTQSLAQWNKSKSDANGLTPRELQAIRDKNYLDIQLYEFAVRLFDKRLALLKSNFDSTETGQNINPKAVVYVKSNPPKAALPPQTSAEDEDDEDSEIEQTSTDKDDVYDESEYFNE